MDSGWSELSSRHTTENITRIDAELYKAAVEGDFEKFIHVRYIEGLLTPKKNTVLHVHLTSTTTVTTQNVSKSFVCQILAKFRDWIHRKNKAVAASENFVAKILDKSRDGVLLIPNANGETPLHLAARYGHPTITQLLIERAKTFRYDVESGIGVEKDLISAKTKNDDTALHEAVRYGHIEVVEILLEQDPDLSNIANRANETPLFLATERKYKKSVRKILEQVESPAYKGPRERTALHVAVINGDMEIATDLLRSRHLRTAVRHPDERGWLPLHYAVKVGNKRLTKLLLKQDVNSAYVQDKEGRTALHIAAYYGHQVITEMIMKKHPDCSELVDDKGWNALHYAVNGNDISSILSTVAGFMRKPWLSNLYNEMDLDGNTPLHHLALSRLDSVALVFHKRVDKVAKNKKDDTALDIAEATIEDSEKLFAHQYLIVDLKRAGAVITQPVNVKPKSRGAKVAFTKEAKESHLIVATLIATVTFAAAFTLPGGTIQDDKDKGTPILGHRASFKAFIISDTIALVMSASAALIHLFSPLDKTKWLDYYLSEIAFSFILVAIATMILAFATGTYAVLGSSSIGIAMITVGLSFFFVFRQVMKMTFSGPSLLMFMINLGNVIGFPFFIFGPRRFGFFGFLFKRSDQKKVIP